MRRTAGWVVNGCLRAALAAFAWQIVTRPEQAGSFAAKGLGPRLAVMGAATLVVPAVHNLRPRFDRFPVWTDDLYLSLFAVDAGGNALRLFDTMRHFDLLPHFHGPGAVTVVVGRLLGTSARRAFLIGQGLHVLLEIQEHVSDALFGLHNVKGPADTARDMVAGLAGGATYVLLWRSLASPREDAPDAG